MILQTENVMQRRRGRKAKEAAMPALDTLRDVVTDWGDARQDVAEAVAAGERGDLKEAVAAWERAQKILREEMAALRQKAGEREIAAAIVGQEAAEAQRFLDKAGKWRQLAGEAAMGTDGRFRVAGDEAA